MTLTADQLTRTTLLRQGLLERSPIGVVEAVRRFGPLQSQSAASPYLALWARVTDFDPGDLDVAYRSGELVKASSLRLTLHTVCADDHASYRTAMLPSLRAAGFGDRRFTSTGMSVERAEQLTADLEDFLGEPRTRREIETEMMRLLGEEPAPGLWRALRFTAPWRHQPGEHPWTFGDPARFVAQPDEQPDPAAATELLVRRFLQAFGPASRRDIGQFSMLRLAVVDEALGRIEDLVEHDGPDGNMLDLAGLPIAEPGATPPRLLPMWDSTLLAYADRGRMIPDEFRPHVTRRNGDVLPVILVDGRVAGVWRVQDDAIEISAFRTLADEVLDELAVEARSLHHLVDERDPSVYRRHHHWWKDLPIVSQISLPAP